MRKRPSLLRRFLTVIGAYVIAAALLAAVYYPRDTDQPLSEAEQAKARAFYTASYSEQVNAKEEKEDPAYVRIAEQAAQSMRIEERVSEFVRTYGLQEKRVLDVGAGRGYLQDCARDYTGLDISPAARRFFHKPFVLGTATAMPFQDASFDGAWSIWVLEHVPNPEAALREIRRVVKNNGMLYLLPAWSSTPYAAEGYGVRPYSDFGLGGRFVKATLGLRMASMRVSKLAVRQAREAGYRLSGSPTRLQYRRLEPNWDHYWEADSDAVNSLDRYEVALWFLSRGDECVNCEGALSMLVDEAEPLLIRVHKKDATAQARR
jgi:SAM-dependent methyltransferase